MSVLMISLGLFVRNSTQVVRRRRLQDGTCARTWACVYGLWLPIWVRVVVDLRLLQWLDGLVLVDE